MLSLHANITSRYAVAFFICLSVSSGNYYRKYTALTTLAFHVHPSAVRFHDEFHDAQAQPAATGPACGSDWSTW